MAKTPKAKDTSTMPNADTLALATSDNLDLTYGDWKTTAQALGWPTGVEMPKAIAYVIANGFKQSMTDASAMTKEQKAAAHKAATDAGHDVTQEQAVEAKAHEQRTKRFADILAGSVGFGGGGPKLPQIERVMRDIAEEQIRAAVVQRGLAMPKGENLKTLIDARLLKAGESIRAAAQTRIDAAKSAVDDLSDILG